MTHDNSTSLDRLRAAVAKSHAYDIPDSLPGETRWQSRIRRKVATAAWFADHREAYQAMADELLPLISHGQWISTGRQSFASCICYRLFKHQCEHRIVEKNHDLFDHPHYFRRKGTRGALTWENAIVTGEPYHESNAKIPEYLATYGLDTVLVGSALSPWYPGSTYLVIVGKRLDLVAAEQLGFRILAHA